MSTKKKILTIYMDDDVAAVVDGIPKSTRSVRVNEILRAVLLTGERLERPLTEARVRELVREEIVGSELAGAVIEMPCTDCGVMLKPTAQRFYMCPVCDSERR